MSVADGSPRARSKDHAAYKPSVPSKLRSESSRKEADSDRGSKSEHRGVPGSSSSDSPPLDTVDGDFASQLERMPLLDDEPPIPKLVNPPWPLSKSKRGSVRQIAAKFEGADRESSTPAGARHSLSDDQPRTSTSGPRNSVPSRPVGGDRGSGQACPYGSHKGADDPFVSEAGHAAQASKSVGSKKDQADERAWERLTAALGHMPPGDLALLQEFLVGQSQGEASTGTAGRKSIEMDGRLGGITGEKQSPHGRVEDDLWRRGVEMSLGREQFSGVYGKWRGRGSLEGEGFGVAPPRCRRCGRLDAGFEEEWVSVYRRLRGEARRVEWDVEEKLEGVMRDVKEGSGKGGREVRGRRGS